MLPKEGDTAREFRSRAGIPSPFLSPPQALCVNMSDKWLEAASSVLRTIPLVMGHDGCLVTSVSTGLQTWPESATPSPSARDRGGWPRPCSARTLHALCLYLLLVRFLLLCQLQTLSMNDLETWGNCF